MNGKLITGSDVITSLINKSRRDVDSSISLLLDTITEASSNGDTIAYKNAMQSVFTKLVNEGWLKLHHESIASEIPHYSNVLCGWRS